jgi:hypothetical protein
MTCPKCAHNPILILWNGELVPRLHYHYPEWINLAKLGDVPSRMMLLAWWPSRRSI